jgi:hypothetical protein
MSFLKVGIVAALLSSVSVSAQAGVAFFELKGPGVIKITARQIQHQVRSTKAGAGEFTRFKLYNTRNTKKSKGHGDLVSTYVGDRRIRNCTGSFTLPRGQIVVGGTIGSHDSYVLAVLGGTRIYNNVGGALTVTSLRVKPPAYLLLFRLLV